MFRILAFEYIYRPTNFPLNKGFILESMHQYGSEYTSDISEYVSDIVCVIPKIMRLKEQKSKKALEETCCVKNT
jgi:hypothetical protein